MYRILVGLSFIGLIGCSSRDYGEHPPYSASGIVLVNGEPAHKALVTLLHEGNWGTEAIVPSGWTDEEGRFVLETYGQRDGAPAGQYRVTVVWPAPHKGMGMGVDRLGGKYNKRDSKELKVTIEKKTNTLEPFQLTVDPTVIAKALEKEKNSHKGR
jgi:hypothetical protein